MIAMGRTTLGGLSKTVFSWVGNALPARRAGREQPASRGAACEELESRVLLSSYDTATYFPVATGQTWNYSGTYELNGTTFNATANTTSSAATVDSTSVTKFDWAITPSGATEFTDNRYFTVTSSGLELYEVENTEAAIVYTQPIKLLNATATDGDDLTWTNAPISVTVDYEGTSLTGNGTATGSSTVVGTQTVTLPNGSTISAFEFSINETDSYSVVYDGVAVTVTLGVVDNTWLANNVGVVKSSETDTVKEDVGGTITNDTVVESLTDSDNLSSGTPLALTTPATATSVFEGDSYAIDWTGGNPTDTVQVWAEGGPNNAWTELTTGVPQTAGSYTWNTTGVAHGWYYFQAWDLPTSGSSYAVQSPNYLHIEAVGASPPVISLTNPALAGDAVAQGTTYNINFTATDGTGDTNPIFVQLWMYSGNTGQWTELPGANYLPASQGSYALSTTSMTPGWYSFAAHATDGDEWSYASSPGWLNVTVPTPTIAFTTPTSGQSVAAGGTFNLNWNITGLSTNDASSATVQIWAQHLVNGSPVWSEIAASVSASAGTYAWSVPTTPGAGTYYAFSIWVNDGDVWWAQASPNWLQVT